MCRSTDGHRCLIIIVIAQIMGRNKRTEHISCENENNEGRKSYLYGWIIPY